MVRTLNTLLQLLWPHDDTLVVGHNISQGATYKNTSYLFSYKDPSIQSLVKRTKYQADTQAAKQLAHHLDTYLSTIEGECAIIPMPVSYQRWRERGYNHIELICRQSKYASQMRMDILTKTSHTTQQTQVTRQERVQQQRGTFGCNPAGFHNFPCTVILLDDVTTTGATMSAARTTIQPYLPPHTKLICLALAH
jgi:competence protein ComFC